MLSLLLAVGVLADASKTEPAKARALLQAWQKRETEATWDTTWNSTLIKGFPASAFEAPPPFTFENNCRKGRLAAEQAQVPVPVQDVVQLRGKMQIDIDRVVLQMTLANQSDERVVTILENLFEMRGKELAQVQHDTLHLSLFNPSVVPLPDRWRRRPSEMWLAAFRHQEFSSLNSHWCIPRCVASVIVLAVLDSEFRMMRPARVLTHQDVLEGNYECWTEAHECNFGPEDPRLLWHPDTQKMHLFFNSKLRTKSPLQSCPKKTNMIRMHAAELASDLTVSRKYQIALDSEVRGHTPRIGNSSMGVVEKNWSPFLHRADGSDGSTQILLEQSVDPHVLLELDAETGVAAKVVWNSSGSLVSQFARRKNLSHAHGGVSPVLINSSVEGVDLEPPFYLSVLHFTAFKDNDELLKVRWIYRSYFFAFASQPPFNILRLGHTELPVTRVPSLFSTLVAFPVQMLLVDSAKAPEFSPAGDQLVLFYGAGDSSSRFLQLSLSDLSSYL